MGMFWGLTVEPKKKYTQTVEYPFTVTSAAVDPSGSNADTVLYLSVDGSEYVLCTLNKAKWPQHRLDTTLNEGAEISFYVRGDSKVHLVGYLEPSEYESDEELDSDEMEGMMGSDEELEEVDFDEMDEDDEEDDEEEEEEEGEPKFVEIDEVEEEEVDEEGEEDEEDEEGEEGWETDSEDQEEPEPNAAGKRPAKEAAGKQPPKKIVVTDGAKKDSGKAEVQKNDTKTQQKQQKKQEQQPAKKEQQQQPQKKQEQQPAKKEAQQQEKKGKAQKLEGGTIAEDVVIGKGAKAKSGKMVGVYYVGRLAQNNKIFDACQSGKPFKFKLGKGEVIRGWDIGVDGMQVGGKRILRIPPGSAYGARGHPPVIPGNSTLIFEVELKFVK